MVKRSGFLRAKIGRGIAKHSLSPRSKRHLATSRAGLRRTLAVVLALSVCAGAAGHAQAASLSNLQLQHDGKCGVDSRFSLFRTTLSAVASDFSSSDPGFPGGDLYAHYVVDAAGVILGQRLTRYRTNQTPPNTADFQVEYAPTVLGDFSFILHDVVDYASSRKTGEIYVNDGKQLAALTANAAALDPDCEPDTSPPTIALIQHSNPSSSPTNANSLRWRLTFGEDISDLTASDFMVSPMLAGTSISITRDLRKWVNVTLSGPGLADYDGPLKLGVSPTHNIRDVRGNRLVNGTPTSINQSTYVLDNTPPTGAITSTESGTTNTNPIPISIEFSENVSGFTSNDLVINGGTVASFSGSGTRYAATISPAADGLITVELAVAGARDRASNGNLAAPQFAINYDGTSPTIVIGSTAPDPTNLASIPLTFTVSEAVTGFDASDLSVSGGTISGFTGSGVNYSANLIPSGSGVVTVDVPANSATDVAGNGNAAASQFSINADIDNPVATLSGTAGFPGVAYPITISFSEPVTGLELADFVTTNATLSALAGSGKSYSAEVTGADFAHSVQLRANTVLDAVGNGNPASNVLENTPDDTAPTLTITDLPSTYDPGDVFTVNFTFSEPVEGFDVSDIGVTNANISGFSGGPTAFSATITPVGIGDVTLTIAEGAARDASGALSAAATASSVPADMISPTATITGTPGFPGVAYPITISFSEPVTGLELGDFTTVNATLSNLAGSASTYSAEVTASDFAHSIQLNADTVADAVGNPNLASNLFENSSAGEGPTITIGGLPNRFDPGDVFSVSFSFSAPVKGFEVSDIVVTNARVSGFSGGPTTYLATVTPTDLGDVTVTIAEGAARDASGARSAAASATAKINSSEVASKIISGFLKTRARNLVQHQPSLTRFLNTRGRPSTTASVTRNRAAFNIESGNLNPIWFTLGGSFTEGENGDASDYALAVIGGHKELTKDVLVGAMLQFDYAKMRLESGGEINGTGWLIGPYFSARVGDHPLFVEGRVLYGQTHNTIKPFGTFADEFSGTRWLASVGVEGRIDTAFMSIFPNMTLSHVSETQHAYTDSLSNWVPAQSVAMTEIAMGLDFEKTFEARRGDITLSWGVSGIWSHLNGGGAASAYISQVEDTRARIDLGYSFQGNNGLSTSAIAFLDGLGGHAEKTYGLEVSLAYEF